MENPQDRLFELVESEADASALREALGVEGVDLNEVRNYSLLHLASDRLNYGHVRALLEAGANPDIARANGERAMKSAFVRDTSLSGTDLAEELSMCGAILDAFLAHGAELRADDDRPVLHSIQAPAMIDLLVERGADPNALGPGGDTPLHRAARLGQVSGAASLLSHGARPDVRNDRGETPALLAAIAERDAWNDTIRANAAELLRLLVEGGASPPEPVRLVEPEAVAWLEATPFFGLNDLARKVNGAGYYESTISRLRDVTAALVVPREDRELAAAEVQFPLFVHGDLTVEGDLHVTGALVVTGTLRVSGLLSDDRMALASVLVGGDLFCAALRSNAELHVAGRLVADHFIYGEYNDHVLFADVVQAPMLLTSDHHMEFRERRVTHDLDVFGYLDPESTRFVLDVIDLEREKLDLDRLYACMKAGRPVLR